MPAPDLDADPDDRPDSGRGSFFADRLAETHDPYELPVTEIVYEDDGGLYRVTHRLVLDVPDDQQVADLDEAGSSSEQLAVLAGDDLEDLVDVLDELGWSIAATAEDLLEHFGLAEAPGNGWRELVEQLNVYGAALEYDLLTMSLDLLDWFRGRWSFDHLLRIASRLPPGSHYRSALADDDELAAAIAAVHGPPSKRPKRHRPALEGFTTEVAYLAKVVDGLRFVGWATMAAQSSKRGRPPAPAKGPETADDRYEFADYLREHEDIAGRLLVRKGGTKRPTPAEPSPEPSPEAVRGAVLLDPPNAPGP